MTWKKVRRLGSRLGLAAMVGLVAGCGGESPTDPAPTTGSVRVTTATTGTDLDTDGYMIAVDGGAAQAIGVNATVTVSNVTAAAHSVALSGLAANCSVSGSNPRSVTVAAGATAALSFEVTCTSLTGNIEVAVNATGANIPGTFDVSIDGTPLGVVVTGSSATYGPYDLGDYAVELTLPANCTLSSGENPRTVTVPAGATIQTVTTTYDVACGSTEGNIEVVVPVPTGANVPGTVNVSIDNVPLGVVVTGSSQTYPGYALGDHTVDLDIPGNCTLTSGTDPRTVTVVSGPTIQTVSTTYEMACTSTEGRIEVVVPVPTGANVPGTVNVSIDNVPLGVVVTGSSQTYPGYALGDHTVDLDIPGNCTLTSGTNPRTVTVVSGPTIQTVSTTYEMACTSTEGRIEVVVPVPTGANVPGTVNVSIDNVPLGVVVTGSSQTYPGYALGDHTVDLDIPGNCTLTSGTDPRTVTVVSGPTIQTVSTTYEMACTSTEGRIEVVMPLPAGANVPGTVNVSIDNVPLGVVVAGSSQTYGGYALGDHTVDLDIPGNCSLTSGTDPRTVTVVSGPTIQTVSTTYEMACTSTEGRIEVVMPLPAGANVPGTVNVSIDNVPLGVVVAGSSQTYGGYALGDHTVDLDIPGNCSLTSGTDPRTVTVVSGPTIQTVSTTYELTCS